MDNGSHNLSRSLRRSVMALTVIALAVLLMSSGAIAQHQLMSDDFKGANGDLPDEDKWEVHTAGAGALAEIYNNTLEVTGNASVSTKQVFHTQELSIRVETKMVTMGTEPIHIGLESEDEGKVEASLKLVYEEPEGWVVTVLHEGAEARTESHVNDSEAGVWYMVEVKVVEEDWEVNITYSSNSSVVWHGEGKLDAFEGENLVELGCVDGKARYDNFELRDEQYRWQDNPTTPVTISLFVIFFMVLFLPFLVRQVEHQLEAFLFTMGFIAVTVNTFLMDIPESALGGGHGGHGLPPVWTMNLVIAALEDPIMITTAVLVAGLVFHFGREQFKKYMTKAIEKMVLPVFVFIIVITLGLVASLITAIISALLLVEVITVLQLDRKTETDLTILACFSIGLGAALTPVGEPLSTIVIVTKLQEDFWYLAINIGKYVVPAIIAMGIIGYFYVQRSHVTRDTLSEDRVEEELKEVPIRAFKVYIFVMALVLLGTGFAPLIEWYIIKLPAPVLYWVNTSSAILDNATLAAAEITRNMTQEQINAALMALLISGGMLIPGNIPNIISANKLHITSKEWARFGVPLGTVWLAIFFVILFILRI